MFNAEGVVTIRRWNGETSVDDKPRSGRPCEAVTSENIATVDELVANDSHILIRRLEEVIGERIDHIFYSKLQLTKVCAKWVSHKLLAEHKEKRVEISKQLLEILEKGYNNIITGDETWNISSPFQAKKAIRFGWKRGKTDRKLSGLRKIRKKECLFSFIL